jgi:hypothetical protein
MSGIDIESISLEQNSIIIIAYVDDMVYSWGSESLTSPPAYTAARCRLEITEDRLEGVNFKVLKRFTEKQLERFVEKLGIEDGDWEILEND